jgi:GTPase
MSNFTSNSYNDIGAGVEADMTGEHLGIIFSIKLPFFIVLTKADLVKHEARVQREDSITALGTNEVI